MPQKQKALIVVSSTEKYPNADKATGLWLAEAVHFYDVLTTAGIDCDFVSPRGGYTPLDPLSLQGGVSELDWKYYRDPTFRLKLGHTLNPSQVAVEKYSVIYFAGGHGTVFDFPDNKSLQGIAVKIYESGGIVSSVCHGACALINIQLSNGQHLINGKSVTGFTNQEEDIVQLSSHVPFATETELIRKGGKFLKAPGPFEPFAVADGRLVTGQNPQSGAAVAEKVLQILAAKH